LEEKEVKTDGRARRKEGIERVPRRLRMLLLLRIHKSFPTTQSTSTRTTMPCLARLPASQSSSHATLDYRKNDPPPERKP